MARSTASRPSHDELTSLKVRLDYASKQAVAEAARLRGISVSDYVRLNVVPLAKREVAAAQERTIQIAADEQLAFWNALNAIPELSAPQRKLGAMMRGLR